MTKVDPNSLMPREKLWRYGAGKLTDAELLAIFLRTGIQGTPVLELAEQILEEFGSLRGLLTSPPYEFCRTRGLSEIKYITLQACQEMTKRYLSQKMELNEMISNPMLAVMYLQIELEKYEREVFLAMFLDNQNRLIKIEKLFFGTINQIEVHPREVIKAALRCNAAAVIMAHNHPSGHCMPSQSDRELTKKIEMACELVNIRLLDHIIVGKGDYFSFEEEKMELEEE